jgi:hypothetical protein
MRRKVLCSHIAGSRTALGILFFGADRSALDQYSRRPVKLLHALMPGKVIVQIQARQPVLAGLNGSISSAVGSPKVSPQM